MWSENPHCKEAELPVRTVALSFMSARYLYIFPVLAAWCNKQQILPSWANCLYGPLNPRKNVSKQGKHLREPEVAFHFSLRTVLTHKLTALQALLLQRTALGILRQTAIFLRGMRQVGSEIIHCREAELPVRRTTLSFMWAHLKS